jgi:hypothetical protein
MHPDKLENYKVLKDLSFHTKDLFYARWLLEGQDGGFFIYNAGRSGDTPLIIPISGHEAMGILVMS